MTNEIFDDLALKLSMAIIVVLTHSSTYSNYMSIAVSVVSTSINVSINLQIIIIVMVVNGACALFSLTFSDYFAFILVLIYFVGCLT